MSVGNRMSISLKINNYMAFTSYLTCTKILLKSKCGNNYIEAIQNLIKTMKDGGTVNCVLFCKNGWFQLVNNWILTLLKDNEDELKQTQYLLKVLELCKLVAFHLGDLDMVPFSAEIMTLLTQTG